MSEKEVQMARAEPEAVAGPVQLQAADGVTVRFDPQTGEVARNGRLVRLGPQPAAVLDLLVHRSEKVVTRSDLQTHLWGEEVHVDTDQGLNACVRDIRAALGDCARRPTFIETLPRRGYRLIAKLEVPQREHRAQARSGAGAPSRGAPGRRWIAVLGACAAAVVAVGLLLGGTVKDPIDQVMRSPARGHYQDGAYLLDQGRPNDLERAYGRLRLATSVDPELPQAWAARAEAEFRLASRAGEDPLGGFERAAESARRALQLGPDQARAHFVLGRAELYRSLDWDLASPSLSEAARLDPDDAQIGLWHAWSLVAAGRHQDAVQVIRRARSRDPESRFALIDEGWVHYFAGDHETALAVCRRAGELEPSFGATRCVQAAAGLAHRRDESIAASAVLMEQVGLTEDWESSLTPSPDVGAESRFLRRAAIRIADQCPTRSLDIEAAHLLAQSGDFEESKKYLDSGMERRLFWSPFVELDPVLGPLSDADPALR